MSPIIGIPRARPYGSTVRPWPSPTHNQPSYSIPQMVDTQQAAVWVAREWPIDSGKFTNPLVSTMPTNTALLGFRPNSPDDKWFRERFGGVRVPGLPRAPFVYAQTPELAQNWFLPWYDRQWWDKYWDILQGQFSLTHFRLSIPQARNQGFLDNRLIDCAQAATSRGLKVSMNAWGGDGPSVESWPEIQGWLEKVKPYIKWANYIWQHDKWMSSLDTSSGLTPLDGLNQILTLGLWCERNGLLLSDHWMEADGAWPDADDSPRAPYDTWTWYGVRNRFDWQAILGSPDGYMDRIVQHMGADHREMLGKKYQHAHLIQYNPWEAPVNAMQEAHIKVFEATSRHGILVVGGEYESNAEADQSQYAPREPVVGNAKGFFICCAEGFGQCSSGFCDGGTYPTGAAL